MNEITDKFKVKNIKIQDMNGQGKYIKPKEFFFTQNNFNKRWEVLEVHDSVAILLYEKNRKTFILVKQFRPAVYLSNQDGFTYELCAGIVDKDLSIKEIAKEEIIEECGYDVPLENIHEVTSFYNAVGFSSGEQTLFYAEVDDSFKTENGGGVDDEVIEIIEIPLSEIQDFIFDTSKAKTPGLMFAINWFIQTKIK
jgi:UDP-sugar diphosphatase